MTTRRIIPMLLAGLAVPALILQAEEEEKEITLAEAPAAVRTSAETFRGLLPDGAKVAEVEMESENGVTVYEVEFETADGLNYEVEFNPDGKILEVEMEDDKDDD